MHPLVMEVKRTREVRQMLNSKLSGIVKADAIQLANLRIFFALDGSQRTIAFKLNNSDGNTSGVELERLIPMNRVVEVFGLGFGIARVPYVNGKPDYIATEFTSNPYNPMFTAAEQRALRGIYNGKLTFKTDQDTRFDSLAMSRFFIESFGTPSNSVKPTLLDASFTMVGGEENTLEIKMANAGDIASIAGEPSTHKLYAVAHLDVFDIVSTDKKAEITKILRGR